MKSEIVFWVKNACLKLINEWNCPLVEFHGMIDHENYKLLLNKTYDLVKEKDSRFWISDLREIKLILPENLKWTNEIYLPMILKTTKIHKAAVILGNDVFTQVSMNKIREEAVMGNMPVRYFDNLQEIREWFDESELKENLNIEDNFN